MDGYYTLGYLSVEWISRRADESFEMWGIVIEVVFRFELGMTENEKLREMSFTHTGPDNEHCSKPRASRKPQPTHHPPQTVVTDTKYHKQYLHQQQRMTMASFTFPQHLMHKQLEPQWFPRSKEETESK